MEFIHNDGGRSAAGYKGFTGDCAVRAICIATGKPYQEIYDLINVVALTERKGKKKRGVSNARTGVYRPTAKKVIEQFGGVWTPTMTIGSGCKVHMRKEELPPGRLILSVSKHFVAVIDGVIHDTHNPCRDGKRCVYGYWKFN